MLLKKRRGMPAQMCCAHFQQGKVVQEKSVVQTSVDSSILGRKIYCVSCLFLFSMRRCCQATPVVRFVNGRCHLDDTQKNCS